MDMQHTRCRIHHTGHNRNTIIIIITTRRICCSISSSRCVSSLLSIYIIYSNVRERILTSRWLFVVYVGGVVGIDACVVDCFVVVGVVVIVTVTVVAIF